MLGSIINLTKKLIIIRSIAGNPKALTEALDLVLEQLHGFTIEKFECNGVHSVLIYTERKRPEKFKLLLNGHLDVIPGKDLQYTPQIRGDKLYGVGAMDMKANVACLVHTFQIMADKVNYPLGLQLVTDEEIGGFNGTKYQIEQGVRADFVVAAEPTNFAIVNKAKGILSLKITAPGVTAHGAYPWLGKNAIWQMLSFLQLFQEKYPLPTEEQWVTTVNLSRIETSNKSFNKVPDDCVVYLDIRYIPEEAETIVGEIKKLLPKNFILEIVAKEPPLLVDETNEYINNLQEVIGQVTGKETILRGANGSSDARHFASVGCAGIEFGPIGAGIGSDGEWVDISSLEVYCQILEQFLLLL